MKKIFLLVLIIFASHPDYAQNFSSDSKRLDEQMVEVMKDILLRQKTDKFEPYFINMDVAKKARAAMSTSSGSISRIAALKTTKKQLIFMRRYYSDSETVTFAYASVTPEIFCRIELGTELGDGKRLIRSFHLTDGKYVKGEDKFIGYIKNMWGDDTPPPVKELNDKH